MSIIWILPLGGRTLSLTILDKLDVSTLNYCLLCSCFGRRFSSPTSISLFDSFSFTNEDFCLFSDFKHLEIYGNLIHTNILPGFHFKMASLKLLSMVWDWSGINFVTEWETVSFQLEFEKDFGVCSRILPGIPFVFLTTFVWAWLSSYLNHSLDSFFFFFFLIKLTPISSFKTKIYRCFVIFRGKP